jgi:rfaE bifunctional protein kinase chain/domain
MDGWRTAASVRRNVEKMNEMTTSQPALEAAREIRASLKPGETMSFVSGNFNVVHPGHLRLFKFAADIAEKLVVGVNPDQHPGVAMPSALRLEGVKAISMVHRAVLLKTTPEHFIAALRPDFVVKGKEFEDRQNPEEAAVDAYGGQLVFSSGEVRFSSVALLRQEFTAPNFSAIRKPLDYPARHGFALSDIKANLAKFEGLRVLVVGDLIIDDYVTCEPLGMSQEDPTIVVSPIDTTTFVGGAGVVSAHAKGLGAQVQFCSVVGQDEGAELARANLEAQGIDVVFFDDSTRPTTRKQRYRAHNKTLLRVNHLRQHAASHEISSKMLEAIEARLPKTDVLLFSDFNYGCLPQTLVDAIVERAASRRILMAADSQASSQLSDVSRFKHMALITPTEREARLAAHDFDSGLAYLSERLCEKAEAKNVVITLGAEGMLIWGAKRGLYLADRLPALNTLPKDPAGAGDSLFTAMALALRAGIDIWQSAYIGGLAAACQVSRVGNSALTVQDLTDEIDAPSYPHQPEYPIG